jgi:cyanate permease
VADVREAAQRWRTVVALGITETASWGVLYYAFAVLLVPMEAELGWSRTATSGAYAVALLVSGLAAPAVGAEVDRRGARRLMTLGSLGAVALVWAWSAVDTLPALYAVFVGLGLAQAMVLYEPAFAVVAQSFERDRERASALLTLTVVAGFASTIFLPLTAALEAAGGWRSALRWLAVLLAVVTVLPHALVLRDHAPGTGARVGRPRDRASRALLADPTLRWTAVAFVAGTLSVVAVSAHLPALLVERGQGPAFAAAAAGSLGLLSVAGRVALTVSARRIAFPRVLAWLFLAQAAALAGLPLASGRAGVVAFVLVYGAGFGAITIARPVILTELYGARGYAALAGVVALAITCARAAAPLAAGWAYDVAGSYTPVLAVLALTNAAAALALAPAARAWLPPRRAGFSAP